MTTVRSSDGTSIAYEKTGNGPALILVDAASGFREFGPMRGLAELLDSDFTVYCYDRRGRGESTDTPPYAVDREIEDLAALIEAAGGSAFVYGFSSGAVLALCAAGAGLAIPRLALLEPPIELDGRPDTAFAGELSRLISEGRPGDAAEFFNRSIGVPDEMLAGMRESPMWPLMLSIEHTLAYDTEIINSFRPERLASITTPTLVINSRASSDDLAGWASAVAARLPNGTHVSLEGEWHGVAPEVLAPVLKEFLR